MEELERFEDVSEELNCCLFAVSKTYLTMREIERHLPKSIFVRIHRSFIININFVAVTERAQVKMQTGESLVMGDHYKQQFLDLMDERLIKTDRKPTE